MFDATGRMTRRTRKLLLVFCYVAAISASSSPPVEVSLRSSWPAQDALVEVLETVSLESPEAFFPLVDALTGPETPQLKRSNSREAIYATSLEVAASKGLLSQPGSDTAVELSLALHAATPKIEAFYHYYDTHIGRNTSVQERPKPCGSWVDWYGQVVCDVEKLAELAGVETIDPVEQDLRPQLTRPKTLPFDHVYPSPSRVPERPLRSAILYASIHSANFRELHEYLYRLASANSPHVEYIFRHAPPASRDPTQQTYLSGYGVSLDLKKTDYLAVDDRGLGRENTPSAEGATDTDEEHGTVDPIASLISLHPEYSGDADVSSPLSEDELEYIGYKAAQIIANSTEPLSTLIQLSQNFPKYASSLARRVVVNDSVHEAIMTNAGKVQGGINMMWLNGASVADKDVNPLSLLRLLRKERSIMQSLTSLGLSNGEAMDLLTHSAIGASQSSQTALDGMFDASDRLEGGETVIYFNDLEKDKRYAKWSPSLLQLMRPMYPGMFPSVRLNLFNIVLVVDLSKSASLNFIAGPISNIIGRDFPFRFGIVPIIETEDGAKMARLFASLIRSVGRKDTVAFFKQLSQARPPAAQKPVVQWNDVIEVYKAFAAEKESESVNLKDLKEIVADSKTYEVYFGKVKAYAKRLGTTLSAHEGGHAFINGKHFNLDDMFLRSLQTEITQQCNFLQEQLYQGELSDEHAETISTYFYDLPSTSARRNRYVFAGNAPGSLRIHNLHDLLAVTGFHHDSKAFVYPEETTAVPLSIYVVADLDSAEGIMLVKEALMSLSTVSLSRLTFVHNPSPPIKSSAKVERAPTSWLFSHLVQTGGLSKATPGSLLDVLGRDMPVEADASAQKPMGGEKTSFEDLTGGLSLSKLDAEQYAKYVDASRLVARELQLQPGQQALIVNGRIVGPFDGSDFFADDFHTLEAYEFQKRAEPVNNALFSVFPASKELDKMALADIVTMASSVIAAIQLPDPSESGLFDAPPRPRQRNYRSLESNLTTFTFGDNTTALYQVGILIDPLTETAQKWSSLINWLANIPNIFIEVHVNPARHKEVPLKRFYRYNLSPMSFDDNGEEIPARISFEDLPIDPIYTLAMDVPASWLVRPRQALYDLDNIQLSRLDPEDKNVEAVFDLDYLVIEGHVRDTNTGSPPRGVQLELIDNDGVPIDDTLVVANLGYTQFKAKPGVFKLQIREGRGRDVFEMESVGNEGWDSPTVDQVGNEITLTSFEGLTLYPRLVRREGMETVDVLEGSQDHDESSGVLGDVASKIMSLFKSKEVAAPSAAKQAEINIFTVASGLLYERFASIMILSVLRNTNSTVKFWFIENFLSPSFLEFIPHFAEEYGFQYELVTYKWPSWLRAQKEKQRIIWAYKILFLDVLFPMDLKKVLFVDADQIVRADLKELVDLDLHGAPYGYTPMGDDNTDMEGFRFWKTGYWRDFLQGRPYHISALYVVDLVRFRQIAAGDILRGQYQQLSADPNSLANLDQDLPNNLQREVPIYSLHEDWLWCETWCSKDRLHRAKTIDLCQNPLTKEPKLARARQIPEWEEYDAEIARFAQKLANAGVLHSRIAAADTRVLADAGTASADKPGDVLSEERHEEGDTTEKSSESPPGRDEL